MVRFKLDLLNPHFFFSAFIIFFNNQFLLNNINFLAILKFDITDNSIFVKLTKVDKNGIFSFSPYNT